MAARAIIAVKRCFFIINILIASDGNFYYFVLMKKIFMIILPVFLFAGCMSNKVFESRTESIQFKGNPTTGYNWFYSLDDEGIVSVDQNVKYLGERGLVGAPSMYTYSFTSLKEGETEIHFVYKRSWEKDSEIDFKNFRISVNRAGEIKITELN